MSAYGTQIFYCRTYDNNNIYDVINKLSPYFYKEMNEITQLNVPKKIEVKETPETKKEIPDKLNKPSNRLFDKQDYITTTHKDCLFWSLYIAKYGYNDYMQIQVNYGVKKQTGKSPMEHAIAYAEEINSQKKKEPCLSFA